jgi:polyisoprenyl-teichoic acid--peptidoglycan teichoic acid transferase
VEMPGAGSGEAGGRHRRGRNSRDAHRRRHRSWGQRLVVTLGCLSALALGASAAGLGYVYRKYERLPRVELSGVLDEASDSGGPENYLVVGIESAEGLDPDDPVRIGRAGAGKSDTIMILRIDPRERGAKLLSLPRDLWVPIAGTGHSRKINAAVEIGGAPLLIRTIDENFGIDIHHYVQVDFAAFRELVEAIDGVPIYFPYPARDRKTGLNIRRTGCVTLDPVQALAFVRSRTYEQLIDGEWELDEGLPDIGRIARQQAFIRKALSRASERGARNPGTLDRLIDVGLAGITVDQELTAGDLFDLGRRFRSFDPDNLETYSLDGAVTPDVVGDADILRLDERAAAPLFDLFREPRPSASAAGDDVDPASVRLRVLNGTGRPQEATDAGAALEAVGFGIDGLGDDPVLGNERTHVEYPPGQEAPADLVARWLEGGAELEEVEGTEGIVLVTGSDWAGVRDSARPVSGSGTADAGGNTEDADTGDSADTATATTEASGTADTSAPSGSSGSTTSTTNPAAREC